MITRESAIQAAAAMLPKYLVEAGLVLGFKDAADIVSGVATLLGELVPEDAPIVATAAKIERVDERP